MNGIANGDSDAISPLLTMTSVEAERTVQLVTNENVFHAYTAQAASGILIA